MNTLRPHDVLKECKALRDLDALICDLIESEEIRPRTRLQDKNNECIARLKSNIAEWDELISKIEAECEPQS